MRGSVYCRKHQKTAEFLCKEQVFDRGSRIVVYSKCRRKWTGVAKKASQPWKVTVMEKSLVRATISCLFLVLAGLCILL